MTNTDRTFLVDADHSHLDYRFQRTEVRVFTRDDGSFATHPKLGCGKTYKSEWDAIVGLFSDHACTNIRPSEDLTEDEDPVDSRDIAHDNDFSF